MVCWLFYRPRLKLSLLGVSRAPAFARDLLASKQGATTCCVTRFALEQRTVTALLARSVFGLLGFVHFGGIGFVAQASSLWVFFVHHRRLRSSCGKGSDASNRNGLHHEDATVGRCVHQGPLGKV
jgi:hypothetical protein